MEQFIEIERKGVYWSCSSLKFPYTLRNMTYRHTARGTLLCLANGTYRRYYSLVIL